MLQSDLAIYHQRHRVWLRDLENSNPELAGQIHVFSSFFYKKLNSEKEYVIALVLFDCAHSWLVCKSLMKVSANGRTSLISSENDTLSCLLMSSTFSHTSRSATIHRASLHWYLAIIYEPEHVLKDPVVNPKSPPRPQTRLFTAQAVSEIDSNSSRIDQRLDTQMEDLDQRSEVEVERDLEDFQNSCNIEDRVPPQPDSDSDIYEPLSRSADDVMASPNHRVLPMISEDTRQPSTLAAKGKQPSSTVDAGRFYQSPSTQRQYGKKKQVQSGTKSPGMRVDPDERDEIEIIDNTSK